ncbi:hypothetical protein ACIQCG_26105 [Streptomyces noursei]|uniref:hypothetical protein n=1 Tax=Streptomyces noursei TaxID=1971 RepID=UPI0037F47589
MTANEPAATPSATGMAADDLTAEESEWVSKWLECSPEWSTEKWSSIGHVLGVRFS